MIFFFFFYIFLQLIHQVDMKTLSNVCKTFLPISKALETNSAMTLRVFLSFSLLDFLLDVRKSEFHQGFGSIVMLGRPAEAAHTALTKTQ